MDKAIVLNKVKDYVRDLKFNGVNPEGFVPKILVNFIEQNADFLLAQLTPQAPAMPIVMPICSVRCTPEIIAPAAPAAAVCSSNQLFSDKIGEELNKISNSNNESVKAAMKTWASGYGFNFIHTGQLAKDMVGFAHVYSQEVIKNMPKPVSKPPAVGSLEEAKTQLRASFKTKGMKCPCCTQFVKMYNRAITSAMACALIYIHKSGKREFFHVEDYLKEIDCPSSIRGDFAKLRFFGLIESIDLTRKDGSDRSGYYKITQKGIDFVNGTIQVPRAVRIFNNATYGMDEEMIDIHQALKNKFSYKDLMAS